MSFILFLGALCLLTGCSFESSKDTSAEVDNIETLSNGGFVITDLLGRKIDFEHAPKDIAVGNYVFNYLIVGGPESIKKVNGITLDNWEDLRYGEYQVLTKAYPSILDQDSIGEYHNEILDNEKLIALAPDVVIINKSQFIENETNIPLWEDAGIKVVVLDYHSMQAQSHLASTKILGKLTGQEDRAEKLCAEYQAGMDLINNRVDQLTDQEKDVKMYAEIGNLGAEEVGNSYDDILWGAIINNIGANNIAKGKISDGYGPLDKEFIINQNPERIVIAGSIWSDDENNSQARAGFEVDEELALERLHLFADRPWWQAVDAVENKEIYLVDHGGLRTILDYNFSIYLAKVAYPQTFKDVNPEETYMNSISKYLPEVEATGTFMTQLN